MADDKAKLVGVDMGPPPLATEPPPLEGRRKSLGFTTTWSSQPPTRKYSLNDASSEYDLGKETSRELKNIKSEDLNIDPKPEISPEIRQEIVFVHKDPKPAQTPASGSSMPPTPNTAMKMSLMEEEAIRERLRILLLRQIVEILEAEGVGTKFTKETFRRTFLYKVRSSFLYIIFNGHSSGTIMIKIR